jgi:hypothetical protein
MFARCTLGSGVSVPFTVRPKLRPVPDRLVIRVELVRRIAAYVGTEERIPCRGSQFTVERLRPRPAP